MNLCWTGLLKQLGQFLSTKSAHVDSFSAHMHYSDAHVHLHVHVHISSVLRAQVVYELSSKETSWPVEVSRMRKCICTV